MVLHGIFIVVSGLFVYLLASDVTAKSKGSLELLGPLYITSWKLALLNNVLTTVIGMFPDLLCFPACARLLLNLGSSGVSVT